MKPTRTLSRTIGAGLAADPAPALPDSEGNLPTLPHRGWRFRNG